MLQKTFMRKLRTRFYKKAQFRTETIISILRCGQHKKFIMYALLNLQLENKIYNIQVMKHRIIKPYMENKQIPKTKINIVPNRFKVEIKNERTMKS